MYSNKEIDLLLFFFSFSSLPQYIDGEYIYGFVGWGSACKVDDVTALPSHIQDGG